MACRSRGTPRIAKPVPRRTRDFAQVRAGGRITREVAVRALEMFEVDEKGFDHMDRTILLTVIDKFDGGPVGIDNLSSAIGEERATIEDVYEPFLIQEGYLQRTARGRIATRRGIRAFQQKVDWGRPGGIFLTAGCMKPLCKEEGFELALKILLHICVDVDLRVADRLAFFGERLMGYRWDQPAYSLSYANRRRLEIARATATNPRILLLDEPAAGMNPKETHEITELIGKLREDGGYTILVIEHDMHVVEGISDRVVALDHGIKIAEGSYESVATNEKVVEAYLGLGTAERK